MAHGTALLFDLVAHDNASPAFMRVAGAANKASVATARAQKNVAGSTALLAKSGATVTKGLTLPLLAVGAVAINEATKYQKGLATIQIASNRTNQQMAVASKGLLNISRETGTDTDALTDSFYVASKAGLSVAKSLDITRAASQGAKAEGADLGTVTNALTSIMASYGSKLRDPVKAMNMLVRGASLAKTTTQNYAGSLSTVIPIASAAGIGFDQVGGAIATLTQHGTSAQQATQELSFAIRNLQAPNNVAISAMNQMGISAVDVSKNLGKRGLTGTFDFIASKLPKSALVYVGAMKRMEAGSSDLQIMQSKMPPTLKEASKQFLSGSLSMREYRKSYRNMGAEGNAQGRAFLTLSQKVKGYSDAVKSGTPAQKTVVSLLKQMMGGAEGLNTWLQLTGESAHYFANSTGAMGAAAKRSSKDVLGFDEVKKTQAFKNQQLLASIKADAIELGDALLPVFGKIVSGVAGVVHWFDSLSGTTKGLIGWSLATVAALGPIISIGGRIGGAVTSLLTFAKVSSGTAATVGTSMQRISTAIGGLALVAGGTQVHGAGGAIMGALGGGLSGAAIGSFFGPIGTAIGGVSGALVGLAAHYLGAGDAAGQAVKPTDDYTNAILRDKNALGANTRELVKNNLQKAGLYDAGLKLGISQKTLTDAMLGNQTALGLVKNAQLGVLAVQLKAQSQHRSLTQTEQGRVNALSKLVDGEVSLGQILQVNAGAARNLAAADVDANAKINVLAGSTVYTAQQLSTLYRQGNLTAGQLAKLVAAKRVNLKTDGAALAVGALMATLRQYEAKHPKAVLNADPHPAIANAGLAQTVVNRFKGKTVPLDIDPGPARSKFEQLLSFLTGQSVTIPVTVSNPKGSSKPAPPLLLPPANGGTGKKPGRASGGGAPEGYFSVGENGPEIAHKRGNRVDIMSNADSKRFIAGTGWMFPGFAKGTKGGKAKAKAGAKQDALKQGVSSAISGIGQAYSPPFSLADVGAERVGSTIASASAKLTSALRSGLSKKAAAGFRSQIGSMVKSANNQLSDLRVKTRGSDMDALRKGLASSVDDAQSAISGLMDDLKKSGVSKAILSAVGTAGNGLVTMRGALDKANDLLSQMKDYSSSITDTLTGAFDPTKSGSITDLITGLGGATDANNKYASEVSGLLNRAKGDTALTGFINTLATSGNSATLETLAGATDLSQVSKSIAAYNASVSSGADAATTGKFGVTVGQQQVNVDKIAGQMNNIANVMAQVLALQPQLRYTFDGRTFDAKISAAQKRQLDTLTAQLRNGKR